MKDYNQIEKEFSKIVSGTVDDSSNDSSWELENGIYREYSNFKESSLSYSSNNEI